MLALAVMGVLLLMTTTVRRRHLAVAAIAGVALIAILAPTDVGKRLLTVREVLPGSAPPPKLDSAVEKRRLVMGAAIGMFRDNPLLGVGVGINPR